MVGFGLLAGASLTILAGIVWAPAYARLAVARYERGCLAASNADAREIIADNDRLIEAVSGDPVLIERLLMSQGSYCPRDQIVVRDPDCPPTMPGSLNSQRHERPAPPPDWLMGLAAKCTDPRARRGLLLVASAMLVAGMLLFAPPIRGRRTRDSADR